MSFDLNPFTGKFDKVLKYWKRDSTNGYIYPSTLTDKLGIGTDSPSEALQVIGNVQVGDQDTDRRSDPLTLSLGGTYGNYPIGDIGNVKFKVFDNGTNFVYGLGISPNLLEFFAPTNAEIGFFVNGGTEAIRCDVNGYVGIGTDSPTTELDVNGAGTFENIIDSGLTASKGVYTNASKQLVSTPPSTGILGYWKKDSSIVSLATDTDFVWVESGHVGIGSDYNGMFIGDGEPLNQASLKISSELDSANSSGILIYQAHNPSEIYTNSVFTGIGGYNIPEGTNFDGTNEIVGLKFGNYQYFDNGGVFTSSIVGSLLTDWLGIDTFGMNAVDASKALSKDVYGVRSQPVIKGTATDTYGFYFKKSNANAIIGGEEIGLCLERPTEGNTNFQTVLDEFGAGSGIWFNGIAGQRLYSDGTNLCSAAPIKCVGGLKSSDGSAGITQTITTAKLTSGGADGSMTFKNGILTAQTAAT